MRHTRRTQLKWNMIAMLTICWFIPLGIISFCMLFIVSDKINRQLENSIISSSDKAIEMCQVSLNEAITASKNASYFSNIKDGYAEYMQGGSFERLSQEVQSFLNQQYRYNPNFNMTYIHFNGNENRVFFPYKNQSIEVQRYINTVLPEVKEISRNLDTKIAFIKISNRLYMIRNIVNQKFEPFAVIVMELNQENMFGGLDNIWGYHEGDVFIDGISLLNVYEKDPVVDMIEGRITPQTHYYHGKEGSYIYKRLETDGHSVAYAIELDSATISYEIQTVWYLLILFLLFMIPLIIMVFLFFHKKVNVPIGGLRKACREIQKENYGYHIQAVRMDEEFYYLSEAFNSMSDTLKNQFEKIYMEELALRDARIMALQSQINPHFLNNTLEIINWEARMNGDVKVSAMIEALSIMLEATMNRKGEPLISLTEEMSYVEAYLYIIARRFGDKLEIDKQIKQDFMRVKVPRLIIQPIIENAVEHGMDIRKKGRISIRVYREGDKVHIEVMDNGHLSDKDRIKIDRMLNGDNSENTSSLSLGIRNVNKRLKMIYGTDCGLTIISNKDGFTVSTIIVKMDKPEEQ